MIVTVKCGCNIPKSGLAVMSSDSLPTPVQQHLVAVNTQHKITCDLEVAHAAICIWCRQLHHTHLVGGESACLVTADHCGATKSLY